MADIRRGRLGDFDQIFPLLGQLWPEMRLEEEETRKTYLSYLDSERDYCLCALEGEELIGFCAVNIKKSLLYAGDMVYMDVLIVKEGFRKTGIGAGLLEQSSEIAREMGCRAMELDSAFPRTGAHEFYKTQGFRQLGIFFGKSL